VILKVSLPRPGGEASGDGEMDGSSTRPSKSIHAALSSLIGFLNLSPLPSRSESDRPIGTRHRDSSITV
ncbi:hypothetical protein TorRG33x02_092790, partial [Trema orientale]